MIRGKLLGKLRRTREAEPENLMDMWKIEYNTKTKVLKTTGINLETGEDEVVVYKGVITWELPRIDAESEDGDVTSGASFKNGILTLNIGYGEYPIAYVKEQKSGHVSFAWWWG